MINCIKIVIYQNRDLFETISSVLNKIDLNIETIVSNNEYIIIIGNCREIHVESIDYSILVNTEINIVDKYVNRSKLLITNYCLNNLKNIYCIENTDTDYLTGVILSLLGVPLENSLNIVNRESWRDILKGYTDTLYKKLNIEIKRIE